MYNRYIHGYRSHFELLKLLQSTLSSDSQAPAHFPWTSWMFQPVECFNLSHTCYPLRWDMPSPAGVDWRLREEESVARQHPALSTLKGQIEISFMRSSLNFTHVNSWKFLKFCRVLSSRRRNQMSAYRWRINRSLSRCFPNEPNGLHACPEGSPGLFFLLAAPLPTFLCFLWRLNVGLL